MLQTRTFQQKVLAGAQGNYAGLHWYVEARVSHRLIVPVCWPDRWVPLVAVGNDPAISRQYVEILCALVASNSAHDGTEFNVALTHDEALHAAGTQWYAFGEQDHICRWCAAVGWGQCNCPSSLPPEDLLNFQLSGGSNADDGDCGAREQGAGQGGEARL